MISNDKLHDARQLNSYKLNVEAGAQDQPLLPLLGYSMALAVLYWINLLMVSEEL